jgi:hypothetical protein
MSTVQNPVETEQAVAKRPGPTAGYIAAFLMSAVFLTLAFMSYKSTAALNDANGILGLDQQPYTGALVMVAIAALIAFGAVLHMILLSVARTAGREAQEAQA